MKFLKEVSSLARQVDQTWRRKNYRQDALPEVAGACLAGRGIHERLRPEDVIRWVSRATALPPQLNLKNDFGYPPITLYRSQLFVIDVYFWNRPETSIHDHAFSGAFTVLDGHSLHCTYDFAAGESYRALLQLGAVRPRKTELLKTGDVRRILSGPAFIHQVWHVTRPSFSMVIRSIKDIPFQYHYLRPGLAVNTAAVEALRQEPLVIKRLAFIDYLEAAGRPVEPYLRELIARADPFRAHVYLDHYLQSPHDPEKLADLIPAKRRDRWLSALLAATEASATPNLTRWAQVKDEKHRLLLALLYTQKDRRSVFSFLKKRFPDEPLPASVAPWLKEVSESGAIPVKLMDASLVLLSHRLRNGSSADPFRALAEEFDLSGGRAQKAKVRRLYRQIERVPLLAPLFQ